jgi:hypothetical protein
LGTKIWDEAGEERFNQVRKIDKEPLFDIKRKIKTTHYIK